MSQSPEEAAAPPLGDAARPGDPIPLKIVSGGQTGVDRAALDVAVEMDIPHGGWCPKGRPAEDGIIPDRYRLQETATADYAERTRLNVRDSGGTLILNMGRLTGGTALTARIARRMNRPVLVLQMDTAGPEWSVRAIRAWLRERRIAVLNVAGPRESKCPGIYERARIVLGLLLERPLPIG